MGAPRVIIELGATSALSIPSVSDSRTTVFGDTELTVSWQAMAALARCSSSTTSGRRSSAAPPLKFRREARADGPTTLPASRKRIRVRVEMTVPGGRLVSGRAGLANQYARCWNR